MSAYISSEYAHSLYNKSGTLTRKDPVSLTVPRKEHLLSDKVDLILKEVPTPGKSSSFRTSGFPITYASLSWFIEECHFTGTYWQW